MTSIKQKRNLYDAASGVFGALFPKDTSAAAEFVESGKKELSVEEFKEKLSVVGIEGLTYITNSKENFLCNLFKSNRSVKNRYRDDVAREILRLVLEEEKKHTKTEQSTLLLLQDGDGCTPLMIACHNDCVHQDTIKIIVKSQPEAVLVHNSEIKIKIPNQEHQRVGLYPIHMALERSNPKKNSDIDNYEIIKTLLEVHQSPSCYSCCKSADDDDDCRWDFNPSELFNTSLIQSILPIDKTNKYWSHSGCRILTTLFRAVPKIFKIELNRSTSESREMINTLINDEYLKATPPLRWFKTFQEVIINDFGPEMSTGELPGVENSLLKWQPTIHSIEETPSTFYVGGSILHCFLQHIKSDAVTSAGSVLDAMLAIKVISDTCMLKDNNGKYPIDIFIDNCKEMKIEDYQISYAKGVVRRLLRQMSLEWFDSLTTLEQVPYKTFLNTTESQFTDLYKDLVSKRDIQRRTWRPLSKFQQRLEDTKAFIAVIFSMGLVGGVFYLGSNAVAILGHLVTYIQDSSLGSFTTNWYSGVFFLSSIGTAVLLKKLIIPTWKESGLKELNKTTEMWNLIKDLKVPKQSADVSFEDGKVWKTTNDPLYMKLRPSDDDDDRKEDDEKPIELTARSGPLTPYPGSKIITSPITKSKCLAYSCYLDAVFETQNKDGKWIRQSVLMAETQRQLPLLLQGVLVKGKISLNGCNSYCENVEKMNPQDWYADVTERHTANEDCFKDLATLPWGESCSMLSGYDTFEEVWGEGSRNHTVRVREFILNTTSRASVLGHASWDGCWNIPQIDVTFPKPQFGQIRVEKEGDTDTDATAVAACFKKFEDKLTKAKQFINRDLPAITVGGVLLSVGLMFAAFTHSFE